MNRSILAEVSQRLPGPWRKVQWPWWGSAPAGCRKAWSDGCWWWGRPSALLCTLLMPLEMRGGPRINPKADRMGRSSINMWRQTFSKSASDRFLLASATHFRESVWKSQQISMGNVNEQSLWLISQICWQIRGVCNNPANVFWFWKVWLSSLIIFNYLSFHHNGDDPGG